MGENEWGVIDTDSWWWDGFLKVEGREGSWRAG